MTFPRIIVSFKIKRMEKLTGLITVVARERIRFSY